MTPPYPPPPPPQKKRGCGLYALIAIGVIVVVGIIAAIAGSGGDDPKTGSEATSPAQSAASAPAKTGSGQAGGEAADVAVDECVVDSTLGWPRAELTITNNSSKTSNYMINVEFVDSSSNVRLTEGVAFASNVAPGQVVKEKAQGTGDAKGKTVTCRVTKVERMLAR